jgi:hypothetical protein
MIFPDPNQVVELPVSGGVCHHCPTSPPVLAGAKQVASTYKRAHDSWRSLQVRELAADSPPD